MKSGEQRRLAFNSSMSEVRVVADFAREAVKDSFSDSDVTALEVAIVEAANNIVKHSFHYEEGNNIELTIYHNGDEIEFLFQDKGPPFKMPEVTIPDSQWESIDEVPESGRGIFIISEIMDSVEYNRFEDVNLLRLVKKLDTEDTRKPVPFIESIVFPLEDIKELKDRMSEDEKAIEEMAEELSSAYESLNLFYSLTKDVALISDLDSFLENTLLKTLHVAGADWGVVRLKENNVLVCHASAGVTPASPSVDQIDLNETDSIEAMVASSLKLKMTRSYNGDDVNVLCLPIVGLDEFLGTILLGKSDSSDLFSAGDAKLARTLADQIAVSIENARLYSKAMDAELAAKEMEIATNLQQKLILEKLPSMSGLEIYIRSEAAKQVGGDYLTMYKVNNDILYIIVCDAMGKGMSASYFSLMSHMAFHSIIIQQDPVEMTPGQILSLVNKIMERDFDLFGMFMTSFIGKINISDNSLEYASAGHCQPVYYTPSGGVELLETADFMLGVDLSIKYTDFRVPFLPETKLLVYSDGITDIMDENGEMVGVEPLAKACEIEFAENNITDSCEKIYQAVLQMSNGTLQDDISMIGVERFKES